MYLCFNFDVFFKLWKIVNFALILSLVMIGHLALSSSAYAFGKTGHRVIAELADRHLSTNARREIEKILGLYSLAEISNWADEMKSNPAAYWKGANRLHYLNVPENKTFKDAKRDPKGDVLSAFESFRAVLVSKHTSRKEKAHALKFLVHIVGDMHQPLHFGHAKDYGGNKVKVIWFNKDTNLHTVWDSLLIDHEKLSFTEWVNFIDKATPTQILAMQHSTAVEWVKEGLVMRKTIYQAGDRKFSWDYIYKYRPVIREQLLKGGLRLAGVLNKIFAQ